MKQTDAIFKALDAVQNMEDAPICHYRPMKQDTADNGPVSVDFWECEFCGHTKIIGTKQQS